MLVRLCFVFLCLLHSETHGSLAPLAVHSPQWQMENTASARLDVVSTDVSTVWIPQADQVRDCKPAVLYSLFFHRAVNEFYTGVANQEIKKSHPRHPTRPTDQSLPRCTCPPRCNLRRRSRKRKKETAPATGGHSVSSNNGTLLRKDDYFNMTY